MTWASRLADYGVPYALPQTPRPDVRDLLHSYAALCSGLSPAWIWQVRLRLLSKVGLPGRKFWRQWINRRDFFAAASITNTSELWACSIN